MGQRLDDNELFLLLATRARNGAPRKKAAAQVAVTVCPSCQVGRQLAGNRQIALRGEELARVFCDAQWIDVHGTQRSVQDVTPALRAKVMMRDHGKCRVPGCRAAANIEVHHIVPWSIGGPHTLENLIALCDGHHVALHRGDVTIEGPADRAVVTNVAAIVHVDNRSDQPPWIGGAEPGAIVHVDNRSDQRMPDGVDNEPGEKEPDDDEPGDNESGNDAREHGVRVDDGCTVHVDNRSDPSATVGGTACADAVLALTTLGFAKAEARRAVEAALDDEPTSLELLVRAALRRCAQHRA